MSGNNNLDSNDIRYTPIQNEEQAVNTSQSRTNLNEKERDNSNYKSIIINTDNRINDTTLKDSILEADYKNTTDEKESDKEEDLSEDHLKELIIANKNLDKPTKELLKEIFAVSIPTTLFFLCLFLQQTINLIFISRKFEGKERDDITDAIGITHLYINCTVVSVVVGLLSGFEILGGNAYGVKNYYLLGVYYQRAQIISFFFALIIIIIHYFTAVTVLSFFGLTESILGHIDSYIKITMFIGFFEMQFSLNYRYNNIIDKAYVNLIILLGTILLHPLWCYIFIDVMDLKITGAGISILLSQGINVLCGCIYIYIIRPIPKSVFFFNKDSLCISGMISYLKLGLPSAFLMCAEWWSYEFLALICLWIDYGKEKKPNYTSFVLVNNIYSNVYALVIGYMMAGSILISKYISEAKERIAKKLISLILICCILTTSLFTVLMTIFRVDIIKLIRSNEDESSNEVFEKAKASIMLSIFVCVGDSIQSILCAVCRGMRLQTQATVIAFINFYIFCDVDAIIFGKILNKGVIGVWIGVSIGFSIACVTYTVLLLQYKISDRILITLKSLRKDDNCLDNKNEVLEVIDKEIKRKISESQEKERKLSKNKIMNSNKSSNSRKESLI